MQTQRLRAEMEARHTAAVHHQRQLSDLQRRLNEAEIAWSEAAAELAYWRDEGSKAAEARQMLREAIAREKELERRLQVAETKMLAAEKQAVEGPAEVRRLAAAREEQLLKENQLELRRIQKENDDMWIELGEASERAGLVTELQERVAVLQKKAELAEVSFSHD